MSTGPMVNRLYLCIQPETWVQVLSLCSVLWFLLPHWIFASLRYASPFILRFNGNRPKSSNFPFRAAHIHPELGKTFQFTIIRRIQYEWRQRWKWRNEQCWHRHFVDNHQFQWERMQNFTRFSDDDLSLDSGKFSLPSHFHLRWFSFFPFFIFPAIDRPRPKSTTNALKNRRKMMKQTIEMDGINGLGWMNNVALTHTQFCIELINVISNRFLLK